jgi:predicted acyl esterase
MADINSVILWILVVVVIVLIMKLILSPLGYFGSMDYSQISTKEIKIPVGDIVIHACLFLPKYALDENNVPTKKLPLIFFNPGWGMEIDSAMFKQWAAPLALAGPYAVLGYDFRGLGKTPGKLLMKPIILDDIPKIIDFGLKLPEIDPSRVGFIGVSFGAVVALTKAYPDTRIKAIASVVGLSNVFDNFKRKPKNIKERIMLKGLHISGVKVELLSEEDNKIMSPMYVMDPSRADLNERVFLMNCKTDECIAFDELAKNQKILNLPKERVLVTEKGGHIGLHQELILLSRIAQFFNSKLYRNSDD